MYVGTNSFKIPLGSDIISIRIPTDFSSAHRHFWNTARHCNAEYELHMVLEGACQLEVGDQSYSVTAKTGIIIPPGVFHHPTVTSSTLDRFSLSFTVSGNLLLDAMSARETQCLVFPVSAAVAAICSSVHAEYSSNNIYRNPMLQSYLSALMISVFRTLKLESSEKRYQHLTEEIARVEQIDGFFNDLTETCSEDALAEMLHLSKRQLSRTLYRHYGIGFRQKLLDARMDRASWLLRTTGKPIGEIADLVGYTSESAFFQAFKAYFSATPLQYRKRYK